MKNTTAIRSAKLADRIEFVQRYLFHYGYIDIEGLERAKWITSSDVRLKKDDIGKIEQNTFDALKKFQAFANITETGLPDEETIKIMETPRCGFPDLTTSRTNPRYSSNAAWYSLAHIGTPIGSLGFDEAWLALNIAFGLWTSGTGFSFYSVDGGADGGPVEAHIRIHGYLG